MSKLIQTLAVVVLTGLAACSTTDGSRGTGSASRPVAEPVVEVVATSEVEWGPLNPARGEKGPKAGTLWGDRAGPGASGFLVEFLPGFESPPHIHNVSYRGVVLSGLLHNDDPDAARMWLPPGSFWTQPRGGVHITAAKGRHNLAYIEIDEGPYLVRPVDEEFHTDEVPVNVDEANIVWLSASDIEWFDLPGAAASSRVPEVAFLWGSPEEGQLNGALVELPAGFTGSIRGRGASIRAVVVEGRLEHRIPGRTDLTALEPGSYFGSEGTSTHQIRCAASEPCVLYVRTVGKLDLGSVR